MRSRACYGCIASCATPSSGAITNTASTTARWSRFRHKRNSIADSSVESVIPHFPSASYSAGHGGGGVRNLLLVCVEKQIPRTKPAQGMTEQRKRLWLKFDASGRDRQFRSRGRLRPLIAARWVLPFHSRQEQGRIDSIPVLESDVHQRIQ